MSKNSNDITSTKHPHFKQSFEKLFTIPRNLHIKQPSIEEISHHTLEIFRLLGYFAPEQLWKTVHLFGVKKGENTPLFSNPSLVFAKLYSALEQSGAYSDVFYTQKFLDIAFHNTAEELGNLFDYNAIAAKLPWFKDLHLHEANNIIVTSLIVYLAQNAFNRGLYQERYTLLLNQEDTGSNKSYNQANELKDHFKRLGLTDSIFPETTEFYGSIMTGSSSYGMERNLNFAINEIFPLLKDPGDTFYLMTGRRPLGLVDGGILYDDIKRIEDAKDRILEVSNYKNIELDDTNPFILVGDPKNNIIMDIKPNFKLKEYADHKHILTETNIGEYYFYKKFQDSLNPIFKNFRIIDTQNEDGAPRPTTYTTSSQLFLELIGDFLTSDQPLNQKELLLITSGSVFSDRQAISVITGLNYVIDKLINILKTTNYFNDKKQFGQSILDSIKLKLAPSKTIDNISKIVAEITDTNNVGPDTVTEDDKNSGMNNYLIDLLSQMKHSFGFTTAARGIDDLPYEKAFTILKSEWAGLIKEYYDFHFGGKTITVSFQDRAKETDTNFIVPSVPTASEIYALVHGVEESCSIVGQHSYTEIEEL